MRLEDISNIVQSRDISLIKAESLLLVCLILNLWSSLIMRNLYGMKVSVLCTPGTNGLFIVVIVVKMLGSVGSNVSSMLLKLRRVK